MCEACENAPKGKDLIKFTGFTCIDSLVIIPLLSVSFGLVLASTNTIFKCADAPISKKFMKPYTVDITLTIIGFGLYMLMIVTTFTIAIIANYFCCCKKQKENKDEAIVQLV